MRKILFILKIMIIFLISIISNQLRKLNKKNETPLHYAAKKNSEEIGKILISEGVNINVHDEQLNPI